METSSSRLKSIAVTAGFSFWFFVISTSMGIFSIELFVSFIASVLVLTQIFAKKVTSLLDIFATVNTKILLGILFGTVISLYGILFRFLRIDLLRLTPRNESYWIKIEDTEHNTPLKQY